MFDLIAGVSTGAIIGALVGSDRLTVDKTKYAFRGPK